MILLGHPFIAYEPLWRITLKADILATPSHACVVFDYHDEKVDLCHYAEENEVPFALFVKEEREVILAAALGADFIICNKGLVEMAQKFADDYLFDAKILLYSNDEKDITYAAKRSIDGILFEKGIENGSN